MIMQMKKSHLFQMVVMVVSLVALVVMLLVGWSRIKKEEASTVATGTESLKVTHFKVVNLMSSIVGDLNTLANSSELGSYLYEETISNRSALEERWVEFSSSRTLYDQIRFIDGTGREIVRVNNKQGQAAAVPAEQLQDKSSRYYFKDSIALGKGEVFVSALDLNKEQGKVEEPYKPMLRLGLPVFDNDGSKSGIVLVNVFAQEILDLVQREINRPPFEAMMLNADGFWLLAHEPEDAWSFMFDGAWSFPARHPKVWTAINKQSSGGMHNLEGLFLFETVRPMADLVENIPGLKLAPGQENLRWILVAHATGETLDAQRKIIMLGRMPWVVLPFVLLLQSGITFFRRRPVSGQDGNDSAP
jgi:diguanylate cyclase